MSRITRIQTKQGHPVPQRAMPTQGPFPRDIYTHPPVITDYEQISGNGGPEVPFGSTAQNNFKPLRWFQCNSCSEKVKENDLNYHNCTPAIQSYLPDYGVDEEYDDFEDEDDEYSDGRVH